MGTDGGQVGDGYWKALFEFATRSGSVSRTGDETRPAVMSEEDKRWLERTMSEYVRATDPVQQMKRHIKVFLDELSYAEPTAVELAKAESAHQGLVDLIIDLDCAQDFHKIGGLRIVSSLLASGSPQLRAYGCDIVGELAQNNEYCQRQLTEAKIVPVLVKLLSEETNSNCRLKAMFALSCLTRGSEAAKSEFIKNRGLETLIEVLQSPQLDDRFISKAAFFLANIFADVQGASQEVGDKLQRRSLCSILVRLLLNSSSKGVERLEQLAKATGVLLRSPTDLSEEQRLEFVDWANGMQAHVSSESEDDVGHILKRLSNLLQQ